MVKNRSGNSVHAEECIDSATTNNGLHHLHTCNMRSHKLASHTHTHTRMYARVNLFEIIAKLCKSTTRHTDIGLLSLSTLQHDSPKHTGTTRIFEMLA